MAKMIPPFGPKETGSAGEKTVYSILKNGLSGEFTVIHSLPWLSAAVRQMDAGAAPTGEIDFLVLHPELGALVLTGSTFTSTPWIAAAWVSTSLR